MGERESKMAWALAGRGDEGHGRAWHGIAGKQGMGMGMGWGCGCTPQAPFWGAACPLNAVFGGLERPSWTTRTCCGS